MMSFDSDGDYVPDLPVRITCDDDNDLVTDSSWERQLPEPGVDECENGKEAGDERDVQPPGEP